MSHIWKPLGLFLHVLKIPELFYFLQSSTELNNRSYMEHQSSLGHLIPCICDKSLHIHTKSPVICTLDEVMGNLPNNGYISLQQNSKHPSPCVGRCLKKKVFFWTEKTKFGSSKRCILLDCSPSAVNQVVMTSHLRLILSMDFSQKFPITENWRERKMHVFFGYKYIKYLKFILAHNFCYVYSSFSFFIWSISLLF